ncbi:MAG: hypothetical protein R2705_02535 [Ilumatobacteraceae bacterium]
MFFAWPLVTLFSTGVTGDGIRALFQKPAIRSVAWFTLWQAMASTALTVAVGLIPAYVVARYRFPGRRAFLAVVTVPFVLPTVVVGAAFLALLPESWHQTVGDPARPRLLQRRRGGAHRRRHVGPARPGRRGGSPHARRVDVAGRSPHHAPDPATGHRRRGLDRVLVHLHVLRRGDRARRTPPPDARGRALPTGRPAR